MSDLQAKLLVAFDAEYRSILGSIRATMADVEAGDLAAAPAALTEAFRMAHTLKGSAHVVGLSDVVKIAHRLESMFARVRDGKLALGAAEVRLVHDALGLVEDVVGAFHGRRPAPDVAGLVAAIEAKIATDGAPSARPAPVLAVVPPAAPPFDPVPAAPSRATPGEGETLRLPARHLDQLLGTSGELLNVLRGGRGLDQRLAAVGTHVDALAREWELLRRTAGPALQALGRSPEHARVAQFFEFVGAQLPPLTKTVRAARAVTKQTDWDFSSLAERLHDDVRRARMVPADTVLGGFHQMVRDLGAALGRPLDFRAAGLEVAVDRGVLQALKDPLMHMLRNAVGHGLESADERSRANKPAVGRLELKLAVTNGRLRVELTDDGRGLDEAAIRARAVERGLGSAAEIAALAREQALTLIFRDGLSTAREVTDLAGRGMGMSVVDEAIKKLRGTVEIASAPGRGTTFRIDVPVTLANHHLLLVHVGEETFAIPSGRIESVRRLRRADARVIDGQLSLVGDGDHVPVVSLAAVLDRPDSGWGEGYHPVVTVRDETRRQALRVDAVSETSESLIKSLTADLGALGLWEGAIARGDGAVALVLSIRGVIERGRAVRGPEPAPSRAPAPAPKTRRTSPARILVVDDSITTRTLERGILEANGYHVGLAVDGVDALAKLAIEDYDLVISDVEMPRMNGFDLVGEIKANARFAHLPVIMVTSLETESDRARGLGAGAHAYVAKQKFDQGGLLDIIRGVL